MLTLTRKTDYALVALTHLASSRSPVACAREIAEAQQVPLPILMNILKTLAQRGVVTSIRGARGGYKLAKDAKDISLHTVVRALEGPVYLFHCSQGPEFGPDAGCERQHCCPVTANAQKINGRMLEFLEGVTLADLVEKKITSGESSPQKTQES